MKNILHILFLLISLNAFGQWPTNTSVYRATTTTKADFRDTVRLEKHVAISPAGGLTIGDTILNGNAILELKSTTKGFLPSRMTAAQRLAIVSPANGLTVYDTDTNCYFFYDGGWNNMCSEGSSLADTSLMPFFYNVQSIDDTTLVWQNKLAGRSDTVVFLSGLGSGCISSDIVPCDSGTVNLGSDTFHFGTLYVSNIVTAGNVQLLAPVSKWVKITKTFSDFATTATTNDIEVYSLPAKGVIVASEIIPTVNFSGGSISDYTIALGVTGSLTVFQFNRSVFTGSNGTLGLYFSQTSGVPSISGTTSIRARAISTSANLDAATQGTVDIYLLISTLP